MHVLNLSSVISVHVNILWNTPPTTPDPLVILEPLHYDFEHGTFDSVSLQSMSEFYCKRNDLHCEVNLLGLVVAKKTEGSIHVT